MASVSSFNPFLCKTLSNTPPQRHLNSQKYSLSPLNSMEISSNKMINPQKFWIGGQKRATSVFQIRSAAAEDEWGSDIEEVAGDLATAVVEKEEPPSEIYILKKALIDSFYGTDRGLRASSETRAEIVELITQLEAKNPTPAPTEALTLLNGKWILAYTSFSALFPVMAAGTLPLLKVEEISQTIDSANLTVENSVLFAGPLATTSFGTNAKFEVRSPKRVQIKFEEGIIRTPQLIDSIEIPENVEFLGQKIELAPFRGLISSVQDAASSVVKTISEQPPLKIPITKDGAQSWLLTTYLDEELRISRGDGSSIFVLIKEGSSLLKP